MIKQTIFSILFLGCLTLSAQTSLSSDRLYEDKFPLKIKLGYSNKQMNKKTNDSTYIKKCDWNVLPNSSLSKIYYPDWKVLSNSSTSLINVPDWEVVNNCISTFFFIIKLFS